MKTKRGLIKNKIGNTVLLPSAISFQQTLMLYTAKRGSDNGHYFVDTSSNH